MAAQELPKPSALVNALRLLWARRSLRVYDGSSWLAISAGNTIGSFAGDSSMGGSTMMIDRDLAAGRALADHELSPELTITLLDRERRARRYQRRVQEFLNARRRAKRRRSRSAAD
jgi:hypothetical protein